MMVRSGLLVAATAAMVVAVTADTSSFTENVDPGMSDTIGADNVHAEHNTMADEESKEEKRRRTEKMRAKVHSKLRPDKSQLTRLTKEEMDMAASKAEEGDANDPHHQWLRRAGYNSNNDGYSSSLADMGSYYDYWQQGYRMLGAFIDCDNSWSQDGRRQLGESGDGGGNYYACSRWMMWAAYVDPNYQGGGYYEYHAYNDNTEPVGKLDCHSPDTEWELLGVYRQEFYQFLEQISKHLWAINEYEYVVALAGLAYMTKYECTYLGSDENGNSVYSAIQPLQGGAYQIGLYKDQQCLELNTDTSKNYDSYGLTNSMYLGSKDDEDYNDDFYNTAYGYWQDTQEYTLTNLNEVYEQFKYCTLCIDYPTYQDGFVIGDTGMANDDLINQCWKFHSHDSFTCETDCMALGDAQGTIVQFQYGGKTFGSSWDGSSGAMYSGTAHDGSSSASAQSDDSFFQVDRLMANLFLTFSGILFVITFIAFAIARGSRSSSSSSSERSRALLDEDEKARAASHSRRSKSRRREGESRSKSRSGDRRSKSASRREGERRSKSSSRRESERRSNSRSKRSSGRDRDRDRDREDVRSSSKSKRSSSRRHYDDF